MSSAPSDPVPPDRSVPDWIWPRVAGALRLPYVVAEGSRAPKRASGPWALGHAGAEAALDRADLLLGRVSATIPHRAVTTLTVHLSSRGSRLLRRYRSLLVRIELDIDFSTDQRSVLGGAYLTRLRAPAR